LDLPGRFFDGKTPTPRPVTARFGDDAVEIVSADGAVERWPATDVRREALPAADGQAHLTTGDGEAVLLVDVAAVAPWLKAHRIERARPPGGRRLLWIMGGAMVALVGFVLLWTTVAPRALARLVPWSWEQKVGTEAVGQIIRILAVMEKRPVERCTDAAGHAALDRLMARLNRVSGAGFPIRVTVINSRTVNALTLPGGRILLLQGLIDFASGPDELAGVLAHEIGHVTHRHIVESMLRNLGLTAVINLATGSAAGGGTIAAVANVLVTTSYGRTAERDADNEAVRILRMAGIGTEGLARFFERLAGEKDALSGALAIISTHPQSAERAGQIRAAGARDAAPAMSEADWLAVQGMCG
jgi:Zn-dependent protease with chaperone function